MFQRTVILGLEAVALLWVMATPHQLQAQHARFNFHSNATMMRPNFNMTQQSFFTRNNTLQTAAAILRFNGGSIQVVPTNTANLGTPTVLTGATLIRPGGAVVRTVPVQTLSLQTPIVRVPILQTPTMQTPVLHTPTMQTPILQLR